MFNALYEYLRLPKLHWTTDISNIPKHCSQVKSLTTFLNNLRGMLATGRSLYFYGDYGAGKSGAAAIFLRKAVQVERATGLWIRCIDYPNLLIQDASLSDGLAIRKVAESCDLLVLDELQIRSDVKFSEAVIENLVRTRNDAKLSTIVTSNLTLSQVKEGFPALYSALQESFYPIKFSGHNFREAKLSTLGELSGELHGKDSG